MIIRKVALEDVDQLIELCAAHAAYEKAVFDKIGKKEGLIKHLFAKNNNLECLVVEKNNNLLGYTTFMKQFSTWEAASYVYMDCLFLHESTRGEGIGPLLMNKIKEYALQENCTEIQWQTPDFNERAISFYKRLGAISKDKERFFWSI